MMVSPWIVGLVVFFVAALSVAISAIVSYRERRRGEGDRVLVDHALADAMGIAERRTLARSAGRRDDTGILSLERIRREHEAEERRRARASARRNGAGGRR